MKIKNILIFENQRVQVIPKMDDLNKFVDNLETLQNHDFEDIENIILSPKHFYNYSSKLKTYVYNSFTELITLINTEIGMDNYSHIYFPNTYRMDEEIIWPLSVNQYLTNDLSQYIFTK